MVSGDTVYVGGSFLKVGGQSRSRIASLDAETAAVKPWNPVLDRAVRALAASSTTLYVGGEFTKVGSAKRAKLTAFSTTTGALDAAWQPKADGKVNAVALSPDGGRVYVGGTFSTLNGQSGYSYLGAVGASTGQLDTGFSPRALSKILALVVDSRALYAGQGGPGGHLVVWNSDGTLQRPIYQVDGDVQAVAVDGDSLFGGGHFTNYCVGNTGAGAPFQCDQDLGSVLGVGAVLVVVLAVEDEEVEQDEEPDERDEPDEQPPAGAAGVVQPSHGDREVRDEEHDPGDGGDPARRRRSGRCR